MAQKNFSIDSRVRIGHVHLKVADLERALKFYRGVLAFELMQRFGSQAAFISRAAITITSA
jgi:catechol 2,3-dioxygenase